MENNYIKNSENPFECMSAEAKYWLGYIFADGHIVYNTNARVYSVSLFSTDEPIMQKFKDFIGKKARMYRRPTGIIQVIYNSKPVAEWFVNTIGISNRKALSLNPNIELDWNILHGYFDGDGSIRRGLSRGKFLRYEMKFTTGSEIWKDRIVDFLSKEGVSTHVNRKGNAFDININNKVNLYYMFKHLYQDNTSKLEYKYDQFVALFGNKQ